MEKILIVLFFIVVLWIAYRQFTSVESYYPAYESASRDNQQYLNVQGLYRFGKDPMDPSYPGTERFGKDPMDPSYPGTEIFNLNNESDFILGDCISSPKLQCNTFRKPAYKDPYLRNLYVGYSDINAKLMKQIIDKKKALFSERESIEEATNRTDPLKSNYGWTRDLSLTRSVRDSVSDIDTASRRYTHNMKDFVALGNWKKGNNNKNAMIENLNLMGKSAPVGDSKYVGKGKINFSEIDHTVYGGEAEPSKWRLARYYAGPERVDIASNIYQSRDVHTPMVPPPDQIAVDNTNATLGK